eukprot:sb/3475168/
MSCLVITLPDQISCATRRHDSDVITCDVIACARFTGFQLLSRQQQGTRGPENPYFINPWLPEEGDLGIPLEVKDAETKQVVTMVTHSTTDRPVNVNQDLPVNTNQDRAVMKLNLAEEMKTAKKLSGQKF